MRKVQVFKIEWEYYDSPTGTQRRSVRVFDCFAWFHGFGCNYQEFESGAGNFSTAICETSNGSILNVQVDLVRFVDSIQNEVEEESKS